MSLARAKIQAVSVGWRPLRSASALASVRALAACYGFSKDVGILAIVVAELKLSEVQRQVFFTDVVIRADDSALQQCPEAFDVVGMNFAAHVLMRLVVYGALREGLRELLIACAFIGSNQGYSVRYGLADKTAHGFNRSIFDYCASDIALSRDGSDNRDFVEWATSALLLVCVAILVLTTDVSFVYFDNAHQLNKFRIAHRSAQPMRHVESSRIRRSDLPLNLHRANALLRVEHAPKDLKPDAERILGILKDSSDKQRETVSVARAAFRIRAFPFPRQRNVVNRLRLPATWTTRLAVRPAMKKQVLAARILCREGRQQFSERHHE